MTALQIQDLLHEGKAKKVFQTDRPGVVAVQYKDDATAFNAQKKAQLAGKGLLNWEISARLFEALEGHGIASHYLGCLEPGWMVVQQVDIVPVEVVLRNRAAGSLCSQLPIAPETPLEPALLDLITRTMHWVIRYSPRLALRCCSCSQLMNGLSWSAWPGR